VVTLDSFTGRSEPFAARAGQLFILKHNKRFPSFLPRKNKFLGKVFLLTG
jgi:hypothetical protein